MVLTNDAPRGLGRPSMTCPTIFDACEPRPDILTGAFAESDYAARLEGVRTGRAAPDYADARQFFANSYPTAGLKDLLANVCRRLSGAGGSVSALFRLDTSYGGGKTHGLIALYHAAQGMGGVSNIDEFVDPALVPKGTVRIAACDGENADPANGRLMGDGVRAYTPWGEIAFMLAGKEGYDRVRASDEARVAPGADTIQELFRGDPTLIVLDELGEYLRKAAALSAGRGQLSSFLKALLTAVESSPTAALVYTLAIRPDGGSRDAFSAENQQLRQDFDELTSVSGRKATHLNPTRDDETAAVLRRRLFARVDEQAAQRGEPPPGGPPKLLVHDRPLVHWDDAFRSRRPVAEGAVRADGIVVAPPLLDEDLGLAERMEDLPVQQLVPEPGVEALAVAVLPG